MGRFYLDELSIQLSKDEKNKKEKNKEEKNKEEKRFKCLSEEKKKIEIVKKRIEDDISEFEKRDYSKEEYFSLLKSQLRNNNYREHESNLMSFISLMVAILSIGFSLLGAFSGFIIKSDLNCLVISLCLFFCLIVALALFYMKFNIRFYKCRKWSPYIEIVLEEYEKGLLEELKSDDLTDNKVQSVSVENVEKQCEKELLEELEDSDLPDNKVQSDDQ